METTKENRWAVLIGVDYYIGGSSRPGVTFRNLRGCVEDVLQIRKYLQQSFGVKDSHIYQLTATTPHDNSSVPLEDRCQWPTYENMINAFQEVSRLAKPEDLVYLHYSGHGIRTSTRFGDLKGHDCLDEALVPTDIACNGGRYFRDVEVAYLLQKMVDRNLIVTLVLDCCHSGGANRSKNNGVENSWIRGIDMIDRNKLDTDKSAFRHDEIETVIRRSAPAAGRKVAVENHWLLESRDYTFLAACRAHEFAVEHVYNDKIQGVFTHSLLSTLKSNPQRITYYRLRGLVAAKVREKSHQQTVELKGEADRLFYSSGHLDFVHASTVLGVYRAKDQMMAQLDVGTAHGVSVGMEFDVWPKSCSDFGNSKRLGRLVVEGAKDVTAEASLVEVLAQSQQLEAQCRALPRTALPLQRPVRLLYPASPQNHTSKEALDEVREACKKHGTAFAPLTNGLDTTEHFQVQVQDGKYYHILDKTGKPFQYSIPQLSVDAEHSAEKLVRRLTHLAKYFNILDLKSRTEVSLITIHIKKKLASFPCQPRLSTSPPLAAPTQRSCEAAMGEWVLLEVTNITGSVLNITVLDLNSSWQITQIYPHSGAPYETLDAGKTLSLPLKITELGRSIRSEIIDTLKVFATVECTSFRWLELAQLDHEKLRHGRQPSRGNVLELYQAAMMESTTRDGVLQNQPLGWDVKHATVKRKHIA